MDRSGLLSRLAALAAAAVLATGVAACGGGDGTTTPAATDAAAPQQPPFTDDRDGLVEPDPASDRANRSPRGPSVTYNDPPPPIAAAVRAAADAAGCTVTSYPSEADPQSHISGEAAAQQSIPPLSGAHNERWADYGVYDRPVPFKYQLHNLEHGGVFVHYGTEVPVEGVNALREMWGDSPAYLLVAPDSHPQFPKDAVVAGSQQRWIVCKPFTPTQVSAIRAFVNEYRGRGPEQIQAANAGGERPGDLPEPVLPDTGA